MFSKLINTCQLLVISFVLSISTHVYADIVVITHHDSKFNSISKVELRKLFLGKSKALPDGSKAKLFEPVEGESRSIFLKDVLRKNESRLSSYWSRMMFSGKGTPPKPVNTEAEIITLVAATKHAISYVESSLVSSSVKVVKIK